MGKYKKPKLTIKKIKLKYFFKNENFIEGVFGACSSGCTYNEDCNCCIDGNSCFLENTQILLANGLTKPIQKIFAGEEIFSYNLNKKKLIKAKVKQLLVYQKKEREFYLINGNIKVTAYHRFWVEKEGWRPVYQLKKGDILFTHEQKKLPIKDIKKLKAFCRVYNLCIEDENHNYFAEGVLVHNVKIC